MFTGYRIVVLWWAVITRFDPAMRLQKNLLRWNTVSRNDLKNNTQKQPSAVFHKIEFWLALSKILLKSYEGALLVELEVVSLQFL